MKNIGRAGGRYATKVGIDDACRKVTLGLADRGTKMAIRLIAWRDEFTHRGDAAILFETIEINRTDTILFLMIGVNNPDCKKAVRERNLLTEMVILSGIPWRHLGKKSGVAIGLQTVEIDRADVFSTALVHTICANRQEIARLRNGKAEPIMPGTIGNS